MCAEYFRSHLVVNATLVQTTTLHDKDDPEGISAHIYTLQVNQVIRGSATGRLQVYEGNDSGRATFDWVPSDGLPPLSFSRSARKRNVGS